MVTECKAKAKKDKANQSSFLHYFHISEVLSHHGQCFLRVYTNKLKDITWAEVLHG